MTELSLFSGVGGGLLATKHLLGWRTIGYVEIEEYCQKVILQRIEDGLLDAAPIFGDIRKFISEGYAESYKGMVDVITGGFPCQDISIAGTKIGIDGPKSGKWKEFSKAIRIIKPEYVFVENSPMLTIRGLGTILRDLASMGFDARWGVLSASDVNLPHKRERIWVVAYPMCRVKPLGGYIPGGRWKQKQIAKLPDWKDVCEPGFLGKPNGLAYRMERNRAIGNGQVPAVVEAAWKILSEE